MPEHAKEARARLLRLERQTLQRVEAELRRTLKTLVVEAIDRVVATALRALREQLTSLGGELATVPLPLPLPTRLGRPKRCRVCGLGGTRNDKRLGAHHSREEHERWRAQRQGQRSLANARRAA